MKRIAAALALALAISAPAFADQPEGKAPDGEIIKQTAIYWAGINCGKMVADTDFSSAMAFWQGLDKETAAFAMRRVKFMTDKAANREVACLSVAEAMAGE